MSYRPQHSILSQSFGSSSIDARQWQILCVAALADLDGNPLTTSQIASRCGITARQVRQQLVDLPKRDRWFDERQENDSRPWTLSPSCRNLLEKNAKDSAKDQKDDWDKAWKDEWKKALKSELRALSHYLQIRGRSAPSSDKDESLRCLERAEAALYSGQIDLSRRLLQQCQLDLRHGPGKFPPKDRPLFRARIGAALVRLYMTIEDSARTEQIAKTIFRSQDKLPAEYVAHIYGNTAGTVRMRGPEQLPASVQLFDQGIAFVVGATLNPAEKRRMLRWLWTQRSTPLALLGQIDQAERSLALGTSFNDGSRPEDEAEVCLMQARLSLLRGRREQAREYVDRATTLAEGGPHWLQGWIPRYRADVEVGSPPRDGLRDSQDSTIRAIGLAQCLRAWRYCQRYSFQEKLILARLAALRIDGRDVENLSAGDAEAFQDVARAIATRHRSRHDVRRSECPRCGIAPLWVGIVHGLDLNSELAWRFFM